MPGLTSPYLNEEPPTSTGRVLLARAFAHWCGLHYGHAPEEIAAAFEGVEDADVNVRKEIGIAARMIGELIASGRMRTYARPFGGGTPQPVPQTAWELDDFRVRMARSALDPAQPFNADADPTHWIFVDLEQFNGIVETSCAEFMSPSPRPVEAATDVGSEERLKVLPKTSHDRHVRLPELMQRTGMSKSTIYRRITQNRFPLQLQLGGNIAAWRESDVAAWLADPQ